MSKISTMAGLSQSYTNHCIRATNLTALDDVGIEARHIMRVSGHKSEASIRSYACRLNAKKKEQISETLSAVIHGQMQDSDLSSPPPKQPCLDLDARLDVIPKPGTSSSPGSSLPVSAAVGSHLQFNNCNVHIHYH